MYSSSIPLLLLFFIIFYYSYLPFFLFFLFLKYLLMYIHRLKPIERECVLDPFIWSLFIILSSAFSVFVAVVVFFSYIVTDRRRQHSFSRTQYEAVSKEQLLEDQRPGVVFEHPAGTL